MKCAWIWVDEKMKDFT